MSTLFWICVGIVIGWNFPQPPWAKSWQEKAVSIVKEAGNKINR